MGGDLVAVLARQRAHVDVEVDDVGDHVRLHHAHPSTTFGENVVCVQAWRWVAAPTRGIASSAASMRSRVEQRLLQLVVDAERLDLAAPQLVELRGGPVVGEALHDGGRLDSALSMRNGIEPWPGVPRTRSRRQATPFSPTVTPIGGASGLPVCRPPLSVSR